MAVWDGPLCADRVALVTGGAGAIGAATCRALADHGADVVVVDIDAERTAAVVADVEARGRRALGVVRDLTLDGEPEAAVREAEEALGRVDVLVNALGEHLKLAAPFEESTEEGWDALYRINLLHVLRASKAVLPGMKARGWGRIVNFSSVEGIRSMPRAAPYTAFKGAIDSFTKSLGVEVAGTGLGAVRLDSGDLGVLAVQVREQLDALGASATKIIVTSDLDEYAIAALAAAPVDGYGVGTELVTGSGHPTSGFVYKLVAHQDDGGAWLDVAKKSKDKVSIGGRKHAARRVVDGTAEAELIVVADPGTEPAWQPGERPVLVPLVTDGEIVAGEPLDVSRERHRERLAELPLRGHRLSKGDPVPPVEFR